MWCLSCGNGFPLERHEKRLSDRRTAFLCKTVLAARSGEPPKRACLMKFARGGAKGEGAPLRAEEELTL